MKSTASMQKKSVPVNFISWLFAVLFLAIAIINIFWGNDPGYGIFVFILSLIFFPPVSTFYKKFTGKAFPLWLKIILGFLILWTALGVGELPDKIELMLQDF